MEKNTAEPMIGALVGAHLGDSNNLTPAAKVPSLLAAIERLETAKARLAEAVVGLEGGVERYSNKFSDAQARYCEAVSDPRTAHDAIEALATEISELTGRVETVRAFWSDTIA